MRQSPLCRLDNAAFLGIAGSADKAALHGDWIRACDLYGSALALWRGPVAADLDCLQSQICLIELNCRRSELVLRYADAAAMANQHIRALDPMPLTVD